MGRKRAPEPKPASPRGQAPLDKDKLARLRMGKGWDRAQLAAAAELSAQTIASYEMGRRAPRPPQLAALAAALGVEPSELLVT